MKFVKNSEKIEQRNIELLLNLKIKFSQLRPRFFMALALSKEGNNFFFLFDALLMRPRLMNHN